VIFSAHLDERNATAAAGLLAAIVDGSDDAIFAKDLEGKILSWNPAAERMFGYSEDEAVGMSVDALIPEDHAGEDRVVMRRILAGTPVEHYETERCTRDGRRIQVSLTVSALRGPDGAVVGASKILRDITPTREARRIQAHYAAIIEGTDDAIITKDLHGRITSWNRAAERLFGYPAADAIGNPVSMLFPPHLLGVERDILGEILEGKQVDHYETTRITRDGQLVEVSLTVSPLRDEDGTIVGASKIVRDITERKRIEEQQRRADELARANEALAATDRLKDQFLAMANHELRTPLTSIGGFTRTLLDLEEQIGEDQRRQFLEIISDQADRLTRMVDDMLLLSRAELGTLVTKPAVVDVAEATRRALVAADHANIPATIQPGLRADVDPHQFEQMLRNYVDNACKYASPETVEVHVAAEDEAVVLRVCDGGDGVSDLFEPRLFDRFSRSEEHAAAGTPGVGLGLAIVRELARANGGDAWYERNDPCGACFCLRLPLATDGEPDR